MYYVLKSINPPEGSIALSGREQQVYGLSLMCRCWDSEVFLPHFLYHFNFLQRPICTIGKKELSSPAFLYCGAMPLYMCINS